MAFPSCNTVLKLNRLLITIIKVNGEVGWISHVKVTGSGNKNNKR